MRSVNKVIIIGNLTRNPELRQTPNGQSVTTFGVATNREWVTKNGEKHGSAEFHECVAWANLAEICAQYLQRGHLVYVEGYLKTRSWDGPDGTKKFKTEIVVKDMIKLEKRPPGEYNEPKRDMNEDFVPDDEPSEMEEGPMGNESAPESESDSEKKENDPISKDLGL